MIGRLASGLALVAALGLSLATAPAATPASSSKQQGAPYHFLDLAVTVDLYHGKPTLGFVTYYRLNRAPPFAPRGVFEGEEEGGPRLYAVTVAVDRVGSEGSTETMGASLSKHCYTEAIEHFPGDHQPHIGELVHASLIINGHRVLTVRTRVQVRKLGPSVRMRDGTTVSYLDLPYEKAFGCLGGTR